MDLFPMDLPRISHRSPCGVIFVPLFYGGFLICRTLKMVFASAPRAHSSGARFQKWFSPRRLVLSRQGLMGHPDDPLMGHLQDPLMGHLQDPLMGHPNDPLMGHPDDPQLWLEMGRRGSV